MKIDDSRLGKTVVTGNCQLTLLTDLSDDPDSYRDGEGGLPMTDFLICGLKIVE